MNKGFKITALVFLMIANAVILVHAIISHHNYNCIPVVVASTHNEHDSNSYLHNDTQSFGHCINLHCHENFEDCALTKIYVIPCKCNQTFLPHNCDFELLPCFFVLFSDYSMPQIADGIGLPFRQKPYLIPYLTEYTSQSLGLRAPPSC